MVFEKTYRQFSPGRYVKTTPVWAEVTEESGSVATKEGESHYKAGDYLVYNNEDGSDAYCISKDKFEYMYQLV
jgi:NADPH-dependent curcumin reductase CurA